MGLARSLKSGPPVRSDGRYLSIDSSSQSIAYAIFDKKNNKSKLVAAGKINFPSSMRDRLALINKAIDIIFIKYKTIDAVVIEQTIYIQSPQTSRILSYVVGHIWGKCLEHCSDVRDVEVMKWKSHIGYKNVSKTEKEKWTEQFGASESKKIAAKERKERTKKIIDKKISNISHVEDYDIIDAMAIGLWAVDNV